MAEGESDRATGGGAPGQGLEGLRGDDQGPVAGAGGLAPDGRQQPNPGALEAAQQGGGGLGLGQSKGGARSDQAFGQGGGESVGADQDLSASGGINEQQDALRAQAEAQSRTDATDAQGLLDKTRAQGELGSINNNDNL